MIHAPGGIMACLDAKNEERHNREKHVHDASARVV